MISSASKSWIRLIPVALLVASMGGHADVLAQQPVLSSNCRIQLAHFCIGEGADPFWISLTQKAGGLHGFIYFVEGVGREDPTRKFVAVIRDLKTGSIDLKDAPNFCRTYGLPAAICETGSLASTTLKYEETYVESPETTSAQGIRIDLVEMKNLSNFDLGAVAWPCMHTRRGAAICGRSLPVCRLSTRWIGCDTESRRRD